MTKKAPNARPAYWRVVYTARVASHVFRGPRSEAIVNAPTLEQAARIVKSVSNRAAKALFGIAGETELIKVEQSTEAEHRAYMSDAMQAIDMTTWGKAEPAASLADAIKRFRDYESRQAAIRRARRTKNFRPVK